MTSWSSRCFGSPGSGLANVEYDLTVVSLAGKDARNTTLPEQDNDPCRLVNKYLDSVADQEYVTAPAASSFPPFLLSSAA
jgi:hypothetical protein